MAWYARHDILASCIIVYHRVLKCFWASRHCNCSYATMLKSSAAVFCASALFLRHLPPAHHRRLKVRLRFHICCTYTLQNNAAAVSLYMYTDATFIDGDWFFSTKWKQRLQDAHRSQKDRAARCIRVLAKSGRLELGDNTLPTLQVYLQTLWQSAWKSIKFGEKNAK